MWDSEGIVSAEDGARFSGCSAVRLSVSVPLLQAEEEEEDRLEDLTVAAITLTVVVV